MTVCGIKHADGVCVMGECPHFKRCCPVVWDKSGKPLTNEEWFCNLDTEDKAREISDMTAQGYWSEELVEKWLKEIHHAE